ncbi:hypothetical protein H9649_07405 [Sporosarcina sp. Sa2YVA2]|uniref:Uncharacterized protein n=1 Tax=Sporosarcina quadrami TaxID=2762234 RepID=A0ABR8U8N9_9BACL|nr:hypothetical protein [Sporosarcina quadrami]MBD7984400.1 hypothetical protein [Sporosarcina quadrami]
MAMFIALKIMEGSQQYEYVFSISVYKRYQDDVDAILIAEGKQDLIKQ